MGWSPVDGADFPLVPGSQRWAGKLVLMVSESPQALGGSRAL